MHCFHHTVLLLFNLAHIWVIYVVLSLAKLNIQDKHAKFSLFLLDKRCMTSVMKVCGMILSCFSPHLDDVCVLYPVRI